MSNLDLDPEVHRLISDNALLRDQLAHLLTEYEALNHTVRFNLMAAYQTKIGLWELNLFKQQTSAARLKRKLELVQAKLKLRARPDMATIEKQLDREFEPWQAKIKEDADALRAAEDQLHHVMSPEQDRQFRMLYYIVAMKCHPDVVGSRGTEETGQLWQRAQGAYEHHDLAELRTAALSVEKIPEGKDDDSAHYRLIEGQQTLKAHVARLTKQISELEKTTPFNMREQLYDEHWLKKRRREIEKEIDAIQKDIEVSEKHLLSVMPAQSQAGRIDPYLRHPAP